MAKRRTASGPRWDGKKNKMAKAAKYTALGSRLGKLFVLDMGGINRAGI